MRELKRTSTYCLMFIAAGMISGILGPSLVYLADLANASVAEISILFTVRAAGNMLGSLMSGRMLDRMSGHQFLVAMISLAILCLILIPMGESLAWLLTLFFLLGLAEVSMNAGGNLMMLWLHREKAGSYVSILHLCYSLGSMIVPLVLVLSEFISDDYGTGFWLVAVYTLLFPLLLLKQNSPSFSTGESSDVAQGDHQSSFLAFLLTIVLYVGFEITFGGWISTYAVLAGMEKNEAAILVTWFWVSLSLGRLVSVPLLRFISLERMVLVLLFVSILTSVLLTLDVLPLTLIALLFGLGCSALFPMIFTFGSRLIPFTGKRTGYVFLCCGLGAMVAPSLTGPLIEYLGPVALPWLLVLLSCALAVSWLRLVNLKNRHSASHKQPASS